MSDKASTSSNQPSNLPQLLRDAERRVNQHVWGDRRAIVSIPTDVSRDVDILLLTAADEIERMRADNAALRKSLLARGHTESCELSMDSGFTCECGFEELRAGSPVETTDDVARVDWLAAHFAKEFEKGYAWTSISFQAAVPIRQQLDEYMRKRPMPPVEPFGVRIAPEKPIIDGHPIGCMCHGCHYYRKHPQCKPVKAPVCTCDSPAAGPCPAHT